MKDSRVFRRPIAGRAILVAATALLALPMAAAQVRPAPRNHVDDAAGVMDRRTYQALDRYLTELEQKTGTQMIVLTIDSTAGVPITEYALNTAESWKLGQKGKDNGVLIVIAVKDRKYRIETGYGVEGVLPDALCSRVADAHFKPNFRRGNYSKGIFDGTLVLANRVADEARVAIGGMPKRGPPRGHRSGGRSGIARLVGSLVPFFLIFFVFGAMRRGRGRRSWGGGSFPWWILLFMGGGHGRHFGSGWGGGGGSFGGGGGFGGGSFGGGFGGGGASGGW